MLLDVYIACAWRTCGVNMLSVNSVHRIALHACLELQEPHDVEKAVRKAGLKTGRIWAYYNVSSFWRT
jgi:hypothetical protein